jgi:pimeloyl-ACP methyl ester carboxylesterase
MDTQQIDIPYGRGEGHIHVWLHPAPSKTLVLCIHGHNDTAKRYQSVCDTLQRNGVAAARFSVYREKVAESTYIVSSVSEEARQAKVVLDNLRADYEKIILVGHSQGGVVCLQLAEQETIHGIVFLMSVVTPAAHIERKKKQWNVESLNGYKLTLQNGVTVEYTQEYVHDFLNYDVKNMYAQWQGKSLFIAAEQDTSVTPAEVQEGFSVVSGSKDFITISDTHFFSQQTGNEVAQYILHWLKN